MGYLPYSCGWQRITSSGAISDSGKPILICGYNTESNSSGAASPYFLNGSSGTGSIAFRGDNSQGAASQSRTVVPSALPVMLSNGCYVSFDADTAAVTAFYILQSVSS